MEDNLITDKKAAEITKMSVQTLRNHRCQGIGLPYIKLGHGKRSAIRYRLSDIRKYIEEHMIVPNN